MKKYVFVLFVGFSPVVFSQIQNDTSALDVADSTEQQLSISDSVSQDSTHKKFITSAYHFLDSVKYAKESLVISYVSEIWRDSAHAPGKAALFSALLPGLGQIYNGKWWKVPIVYTGLGVSTGFILYNTYGKYGYLDLKRALVLRLDGDSSTIDQYASDPTATTDALLSAVDEVKRYLDISYIVTAFVYLLNIIDALVDAQLFYFDVSDDLTMQVRPYFNCPHQVPGINSAAFQTNQDTKAFGIHINLHIQ